MGNKRRDAVVDRHVGMQIRIRRKERRLSQTDLANRLDITFQQVQKYENGTNSVRASRLMQLARILDVPITYFFDGQDGNGGMPHVQQFLATTDGMSIAKSFVNIRSPKLRRSLANIVEGAAEQQH